MRVVSTLVLLSLSALAIADGSHDHSAKRELVFPDAADGRKVLAVDLHTHSVFSDGHVWPTVRVWEAEKDRLAAMAVTEHLEYQPHADDIPHPDRNRAFELAAEEAGDTLLAIPGAEITRSLPPGHTNAVFIEDANRLLIDDPEAAIAEANAQGGFVFWNHPAWTPDFPDGVAKLTDMHRRLIQRGHLHGIEVANGEYLSEEAFEIALANDLAVLGTSDIHGLIDYDYDIAAGEQRTVTLVLAEAASLAAIRDALHARQTVALYRGRLFGRTAELATVIGGALSLTVQGYFGAPETDPEDRYSPSTVLLITLHNDAPVDLMLRSSGPWRFSNAADTVVVPAHGSRELGVTAVDDIEAFTLPVTVLNAFPGPEQALQMTLVPIDDD